MSIEKLSIFLELRAGHAAQGEQASSIKNFPKRKYHTLLLFVEEQKNHILSEARSEINVQQLRVESADRALRQIKFPIFHSERALPSE